MAPTLNGLLAVWIFTLNIVPPSPPECRVTGNTLVGNDVTLNCHSSQGVPQPIYTWTREKTAAQIPVPEANMVQDQLSGSLLLRNLSYAFNGAFQCRASNEIGAASCTVNIRVCKLHSRPDHHPIYTQAAREATKTGVAKVVPTLF
ncbi:UNVERIFIED_CONTAM: hypothetical protein FKN15_063532 [Acipenser sinensis]